MAKPPPWPRPVSPLHYDPVVAKRHEIYSDESSSSEDETQRSYKRQRIEQLGETYLRGYGLVISTAQIKGPLGKDWSNPWAKSERRRKQEEKKSDNEIGAKEIPETVQRLDYVLVTNNNKQNQQLPATERRRKTSGLRHQSTSAIFKNASEPTTPQALGRDIEDDPFKSNSAIKSRSKVEDWLKKDHGVTRQRAAKDLDNLSSPTARFTAINATQTQRPKTNLLDLLQPSKSGKYDVRPPETYKQAMSLIAPYPSVAKATIPTCLYPNEVVRKAKVGSQQQVTHATASPAPHYAEDSKGQQPNVNKMAEPPPQGIPQEWHRVGKYAAKRPSLHSVPSSAQLPEFEYRRVRREVSDQNEQALETVDGQNSSRAPLQEPKQPLNSSTSEAVRGRSAEPHGFLNGELKIENRKFTSARESESHGKQNAFEFDLPSSLGARETTSNATRRGWLPGQSLDEQAPATHPPSLTTATSNRSELTEANNLPSAQMISNPQVPVSLSSLPSTKLNSRGKAQEAPSGAEEEIIEDSMLFLSTQAAVERAQKRLQADLETPKPPTNPLPHEDGSDTVKMRNKDADDVKNTPNGSKSPILNKASRSFAAEIPPEPNTQAMLDAVTPFAFSTSKPVPLKPASASSAKSNSAFRMPVKSKKRTSFAVDTRDTSTSSQGSIRSALKVRKGFSTEESKPLTKEDPSKDADKSDQVSPKSNLNLEMDTSAEAEENVAFFDANTRLQESLPSISSLLRDDNDRHSAPVPSSQPKAPTTQLPLKLTGQTTTSSSGQQQDAQRQHPLDMVDKAVDEGNDFDLEATMDDLGSFLQSWDPEREAKNVGREQGAGKESSSGGTGTGSSGKWDWKNRNRHRRVSVNVNGRK